jgi:hypothetical protein
VAQINSRLLGAEERPDPQPLMANEGLCYVGSYVLGMGFVLTPEERKELIRKNTANGKLIFPYLGGEEVNTSPTQDFDRYVINFGEMSLEEAERWPDLLRIVREKVKPERDKNNRDVRKKYWWRFGETAPALKEVLRSANLCLVTARVSKHLIFSLQPTNRIFSEQLYVIALADNAHFGILQSRIHDIWAWMLSSTMRGAGIRYAASDCFDTFPFPETKLLGDTVTLSAVGQRLYEARAKLMVERNQGLTVTYNQLKEPGNHDRAIVALRRLHEEMDRAVLDAYGWSDIEVPPFATPTTVDEKAAFERFSDAVIDRLFALNTVRAATEAESAPRIAAKRAAKPLRRRPALKVAKPRARKQEKAS